MPRLLEKIHSNDGSRKFLFQTPAGHSYEALYFKFTEAGGREETAICCLSAQAGCAVGCVFCATGRLGFQENLSAKTLLATAEQVLDHLGPDDPPPSIFTFMGMGEPLLNLDSLIDFYPAGLNRLGAKSLSLSTIVIPKALMRLAHSPADYDLFVSLHSPRPEARRNLIPYFRGADFNEFFAACEFYYQQKLAAGGRKIKFSYLLLAGLNDSAADIDRLAALLNDRLPAGSCRVQLLLYNDVPGGPFARVEAGAALKIRDRLLDAGVDAYLSLSRGTDVGGGCGQFAGQRRASGLPVEARV